MFLGNFLDVFDKWLNRRHGGLYKENIIHVWQKKSIVLKRCRCKRKWDIAAKEKKCNFVCIKKKIEENLNNWMKKKIIVRILNKLNLKLVKI